MASSRRSWIVRLWEEIAAARTPGVLGVNDHADPGTAALLGDTPGTLGWSDHGDPTVRACSVGDMITRLPDGTAVAAGAGTPALGAAGAVPVNWQKLKVAFPAASNETVQAVAGELNRDLVLYGLETVLRQAHFFAQVRQEAGARLTGQVENLSYNAAALKATFGYYRKHPAEAETDAYAKDAATGKITRKADQQAIANKAYGNRYGNGDTASGDGWRFRGRGFIQVTFRDNYAALGTTYRKYYGEAVDFVEEPELLERFPYNVRGAVCFWNSHGLPALADAGSTPVHVDAITAVVNKNTKSYEDRRANFEAIHAALSS
ncbi:MAG TPA: hypothetical protein VEL28_06640 [Candidatus Binatia bacterium]|nr:hypothetical protein [Candidatus Binatia bacterium]